MTLALTTTRSHRRRRALIGAAAAAVTWGLSGCATLRDEVAPRVELAGVEGLPGEGLELRFLLKLRIQNPADRELRFDGVWAEVELRGLPLAGGGAAVAGVVPRFGEAVVQVPVTASGLALARQAFSLWKSSQQTQGPGPVAYVLRGRLGGTGLAPVRFESRGEVSLSD
ncbi:LEA type 2 family protein [Ideonella sp. DXS22W]|uniref:LEA type 2 family protein n=1 Tax=Pseudaquabacterium inlustre TaxID=2984192 RepID=A0ABU9CMF0_9BURK